MNFGFPYYGGGKTRTTEYKEQQAPADVDVPAGRDGGARRRPRHDVLFGQDVPGEISGRHLLGAAWLMESHHADRRARDVHEPEGGRHGRQDRSLRRGLATENGEYLGRPVDVAQLPDGSILVSDDLAGALYRIWYDGR